MRVSRWTSLVLVACFAAGVAGGPGASAYPGGFSRYASGGTAVVRTGGEPVVDQGMVVCDNGDGVGSGGFCLPFGGGDAVAVLDAAAGENVAFQVCVDNNGDGACTSPDFDPACPDQIAFSHDDDGSFFNPVGPLPTGFLPGCAGGPWNGYVVFLCEGVHAAGDPGHAHGATTGVGSVTSGGEGLGTFCGGGRQQSIKPYVLASGNLTCGMSASVDPTAEPNVVSGAIYAGPWRAVDPAGAPATDVQIRCTLQYGSQPGGAAAVLVTSPIGTGVTTLPTTAIAFQASATDRVYLCTEVRWTTAAGPETYHFDGDPSEPGVQCALATTVVAGDYYAFTVPQSAV